MSRTARSSLRRRGVGEYVDLDDLPAPDRKAHHRIRPSARSHDDYRGTVDDALALTQQHSENRKQADGDAYGGDRGTQDVAFAAEQSCCCGR